MQPRSVRKIIISVFILSAVIMVLIAGYLALDTKKFLDGAESVVGKIEGVEEYEGRCGTGKNSHACTLRRTLVKFQLPSTEIMAGRVDGDFGGQKEIELLYNSEGSPSLRLKNQSWWLMPIAILSAAFADLFVVMPVLLYVLRARRQR